MKRDTRLYWLLGASLLALVVLLAPFFTGQTLLPGDTMKSMPLSKFGWDEVSGQHHIVQWMPYLFGGMPCYSSVMVTPSYLPSVITSWVLGPFMPFFKDPIVLHFLHMMLMSFGAWLYLRRKGLSQIAAAFGAFNLMLLTTNLGLMGAGHTIKLWTIAWMPLALYYLDRILEERRWGNLVPGALVLGLMLSAKHIQMSWYFLILAGLLTLGHGITLWRREKTMASVMPPMMRASAWLGLGLLLVAFLYLPVLDYSSMSMRASADAGVQAGQYAASYSFPPGDMLSWWIPGAKGFGGGNYWGKLQYTAFPLYMGALWLPFLIAGFVLPRGRKQLLIWIVPAIVLLILGLGKYTPFFALLVKALPFYAKFRAHMWALAVVQMLMVFMTAVGLDAVLKHFHFMEPESSGSKNKKNPLHKNQPWFMAGGALLLGAFLLFQFAPTGEKALSPGSSFSNENDQARVMSWFQQQDRAPDSRIAKELSGLMRAGRAHDFMVDTSRSLAIVGLALLLMAVFLRKPKTEHWLMLGLALLLMGDLLPQAAKTLNFQQKLNPNILFKPQGVMAQLAAMPEKESFRIWPKDAYGHNQSVWYGLHSISGYHGAKPSGIQKVFSDGTVGQGLHLNWLKLLNVRYVISYQQMQGMREVARGKDGLLLEVGNTLPRISFPKRWEGLVGDDHFARIMENRFDPEELVLVDPPVELPVELGNAEAVIESYGPDRVVYQVSNDAPALALLSEIWLPRGWQAFLDGESVPIHRADHLLRAIPLPEAGQHRLELVYRPLVWVVGWPVSLLTFILLIVFAVVLRRRVQNRA